MQDEIKIPIDMPTPQEKLIEEYAWKGEEKKCEDIVSHNIQWAGDCYACNRCGLVFTPKSATYSEGIKQGEAHQLRGVEELLKQYGVNTPYVGALVLNREELLNHLRPSRN